MWSAMPRHSHASKSNFRRLRATQSVSERLRTSHGMSLKRQHKFLDAARSSLYVHPMESTTSRSGIAPLRPHSRTLSRGVIGATIDGRSREGRYLRAIEADLVQHAGGSPSTTQKILIHRCARLMLRLDLFDQRLTAGEMTSHDARTYNALQNSLRLALRDLGLKSRDDKAAVPTIADIAARHAKPDGASA
jgi:hypothetical protein